METSKTFRKKKSEGEKENKKKPLKVELDFEFLKIIANYYDFPVAVFLAGKNAFSYKPKTRKDYYEKIAEKYERIKDIVGEEI